MEVYVELTGDESTLKTLSETFKNKKEDFAITKKDNSYVLTSEKFKHMNDLEIRKKANEIIKKLNKSVKLSLEPRKPIIAKSIIKDEGKRKNVTFFANTLRIVMKPYSPTVLTDKEGNVLRRYPHDFIKEVYNLTEKNKNLSDALEIYDPNSLDPREYYKIFEIIRKDVGGEKNFSKIIGFSINEIDRFRQSCQHPEAVGLKKSRHAVPKGEPPKKPMSPEEMKRFIKISLEKWILKINEELEKR